MLDLLILRLCQSRKIQTLSFMTGVPQSKQYGDIERILEEIDQPILARSLVRR